MSSFHPTGHPLHLSEHTSQWWSNTSGDGHSSDSSSLGAHSSVGTLFSDSANSQDPNWKNGKIWTSVARDSHNCIQRGWSTSSSESCTSARDSRVDSSPRAEASPHSSGEDQRGASSRPSPSPLRPVTRQSLQTDRVYSLASDIRAWGISTHNSLRSQEPSRPQSQDLDLLTARHWTRLGLQARQPGSPSGLRTPRFDPSAFNPPHSPLRPVSYIPGRAASIFGGSAFRALDSLGESSSPAPRGVFGGSAFQASGTPGTILHGSPQHLWGSCSLPTWPLNLNIPCASWGLWWVCVPCPGGTSRPSLPSSTEPGSCAQETKGHLVLRGSVSGALPRSSLTCN